MARERLGAVVPQCARASRFAAVHPMPLRESLRIIEAPSLPSHRIAISLPHHHRSRDSHCNLWDCVASEYIESTLEVPLGAAMLVIRT